MDDAYSGRVMNRREEGVLGNHGDAVGHLKP